MPRVLQDTRAERVHQQLPLLGEAPAVRLADANQVIKEASPHVAVERTQRGDPLVNPGAIHPSLWRASQLARPVGKVVPSGIDVLDAELPGGGWAEGSVAEFIVKQPGIGEISMIRGAMNVVAERNRPIWLVGCPFAPNGSELARIGLARHVRWVKTQSPADAQWACETILRSNALGALVAWLPRTRPESIRRLQGLAAATDALVFAIRSASAINEASASPLRIALEPAPGGFVRAQILKRRGPASSGVLLLTLQSLAHLSGISGGQDGQVRSKPEQSKNTDRDGRVVAVEEMFGADA